MNDQKEKTALELVDELDRYLTRGPLGCHDPTATSLARSIKSAIERERQQAVDDWAAKSVELVQSEKLREIEKLLSAKRETEMKETIGNLESKVKSNTRTIQDLTEQLKSAIVMRPIAELPDRVPDGCMIVAVGKLRVTIKCWVWEPGDDVFPHEGETHFYILPLPKPARRLHPCYMPGCGGDGKCVYDYSGSEDRSRKSWFVDCLKCHAQGPRCDSEQEAEQAWGYE